MSEDFKIEAEWLEGSDQDSVDRATFAQIVINAAQQVTTELEDLYARTVRPGPRASAYDLAFWLAENWWRLRWEPEAKKIVDWRMSHAVAAVGGGFAWPNVSFASDGVHVLVEARETSGGKDVPVRYIRDLDVQITAAAFENGIDEFVERVLARLAAVDVRETDLSSLWEQLRDERRDGEKTDHRRLEALLGFDPDEAPGELIESLQETTGEAGRNAVDEIAAEAKKGARQTLREILERTRASKISIRVDSASKILGQYSAQSSITELPWQRANRAAKFARDAWGIGRGPVTSKTLSELLDFPAEFLEYTPIDGPPVAGGLRSNHGTDAVNVIVRAKVPAGRRFEIMRLVADHIVAVSDDCLLPVTTAKTDRQKFQRAFAQEFLLPFEELRDQFGLSSPSTDDIADDDIENIARQYDVSPILVRTVLVNQGYLSRDELAAAQ